MGELNLDFDLARRALDALEVAVIVLSPDLGETLYRNAFARRLIGDGTPEELREAIDTYLQLRRRRDRAAPSVRLELQGRVLYLRVVATPGRPPVEVVFLHEEVVRDADLYRLLNDRYQVSRREYEVLVGLRLGKTNRELAHELGLSEGTVANHVHRLLGRFEVPNRTRLVHRLAELTRLRG